MKNPVKKIKEENNLTLDELGVIADVSQSTVYQNISGSSRRVNHKILEACKQLGYDPEEVEKKYQEFKKAKKLELLKMKRRG
ncbi:MAG: helix-turn-helix domain-containing protein [bacterium]